MDVRVEATVATAGMDIVHATVAAVRRVFSWVMVSVSEAVASFPRSLSIGGSSISAVPGDTNFKRGGLAAFA